VVVVSRCIRRLRLEMWRVFVATLQRRSSS
jgi:hypothetical protein